VFIGSCAGTFYGLDRQTGKVCWSYDIRKDGNQTSFHGNPLITDDLVIIGTDGGLGHVYAFEKTTGRVVWKYQAGGSISWGTGVGSDIVRLGPNVYGVTLGDELLCLDLKTGRLNWSFRKPFTNEAWSSAPAVTGSQVYFGALNGTIYGLDAASGRVLWSRELGPRISTSPAIIGDDLYAGTADHYIYRLRRTSGEIISKLEVETIPVGPLIAAGDALMTILNPGGGTGGSKTVACVDASKMQVRWNQAASSEWTMRQPLVWGKMVLAGNQAGELMAFGLTDGAPEWKQQFKGMIRSIGMAGNVLYVGTLNGTVYAYDASGLLK
jgi:outer membrane protein assembly factor BamB